MKDIKVSGNNISFLGLLTILFIGLKLTNNIDWSWFWVLSPLTLPLAIVLAIFCVWCFFAGIALILDKRKW